MLKRLLSSCVSAVTSNVIYLWIYYESIMEFGCTMETKGTMDI